MSNSQQMPDGSWQPAQPIGWQEEHYPIARFVFWLRRLEHCNDNEGGQRCWPWQHDWDICRGLAVPIFDPRAKGELWRCKKCPVVKAK